MSRLSNGSFFIGIESAVFALRSRRSNYRYLAVGGGVVLVGDRDFGTGAGLLSTTAEIIRHSLERRRRQLTA